MVHKHLVAGIETLADTRARRASRQGCVRWGSSCATLVERIRLRCKRESSGADACVRVAALKSMDVVLHVKLRKMMDVGGAEEEDLVAQ